MRCCPSEVSESREIKKSAGGGPATGVSLRVARGPFTHLVTQNSVSEPGEMEMQAERQPGMGCQSTAG